MYINGSTFVLKSDVLTLARAISLKKKKQHIINPRVSLTSRLGSNFLIP